MKRPAPAHRFAPVRLKLPSEAVARQVAEAIRAGHFRTGDRLPSERSLAEQLAVSRPTVREALRLLVEAKILTVRPGGGGGAFVASEMVPLDLISDDPQLRPGEMHDVLEARRSILPQVAQMAAIYAEDDEYDRMREAIAFGAAILEQVDDATIPGDTRQLIIIASMRFDLAIARATRNGLIERLMETLLRWVEPLRVLTMSSRERLVYAVDVLRLTLAALESGEPDRIAAVINARLLVLEDALEQQSGRKLRARRGPPTQ